MLNYILDSGNSGVPASEMSMPRVFNTSESSPYFHVNPKDYEAEPFNAEAANPTSCTPKTEDSVAKRPSRWHRDCCCKASQCRSARRGAKNRRRARKRSKRRRISSLGSPPAGSSRADNHELDNHELENHALDSPEDGELPIREIDVSGISIPRLDINGRVIPSDPEVDGPQLGQGPLIDNTGSELPGYPERQVPVPVEGPRGNIAQLRPDEQRVAIRSEPEADGARDRDDAAPDNLPRPKHAELSRLERKWLRLRHFRMNELPTWPLDWQIPTLCVIIFIAIMLYEFVFFMAVILFVGALNIMLQMQSGPRAISQQILTDIPFSYLRVSQSSFPAHLWWTDSLRFTWGCQRRTYRPGFPCSTCTGSRSGFGRQLPKDFCTCTQSLQSSTVYFFGYKMFFWQ